MTVELLDIINFAAIFQLTVFVFFLFQRKTARPSNALLAVFLIAQIFLIGDYESYHLTTRGVAVSSHLFFIGGPFFFLVGPVFYLYVNSVAFSDFELKAKHLLHGIPFAVTLVFYLVAYHLHDAAGQRAIVAEGYIATLWFNTAYQAAASLHILAYNIASLGALRTYRSTIKEEYSSVSRINLSWLSVILVGFTAGWLANVIATIARVSHPDAYEALLFVDFLAFFIFFNVIFYKALIQPEIFTGVEERRKYLSSSMTPEEENEGLCSLTSFMEQQKPYRNPSLSLTDLSAQTGIPTRHLSQIINSRLHRNFYDFVSQYRIEEAKRRLRDPQQNRATVLEILFDVGFNSKSSFNAAFKKHTGMTPSRYKASA